jgi:hypothetical protein
MVPFQIFKSYGSSPSSVSRPSKANFSTKFLENLAFLQSKFFIKKKFLSFIKFIVKCEKNEKMLNEGNQIHLVPVPEP